MLISHCLKIKLKEPTIFSKLLDFLKFNCATKTDHAAEIKNISVLNIITIAALNASKVPLVIIDKRLDSLDKIILFPEKVEKAKKQWLKLACQKNNFFGLALNVCSYVLF